MKKIGDPREYRLRFFIEHSYDRRVCSSCQTPFWTRGDSDRCNDIPCTDYRFFDIDIGSGPLSYEKSLERFLRFFEREGHRIIDPAPVVARWREDLYLTIASIVVFQPHVTSGKIPPPANPLVIAQPSIRLEDIDNVGLTFGRHMTNFTMGGHHAFNYRDRKIYWKDETVEYAKRFFVEEIGVPEEELYFKESWWEGGGNAGPCLEVAVGGLEVATLVFMQYEVLDGSYREIPLKIVDTGYGIERIAWLTSKTPTAFHAVYGSDLIDRFHRKLGVEKPDRDMLSTLARYAGRIDPDDPSTIDRFFRIAEETFGRESIDVLKRSMTLYSIVDHTKTLALMLGDGVVPSNTGEGYLARLVIRRTLKNMRSLGSDVALSDLVKLQIERWGPLYRSMERNKSYIAEIIDIEEEKFRNLISKAPAIVARYLKRSINLDSLIEIYDSHGIPPEIIESELSRRGVKVEIPRNFYSLVASRHASTPIKGSREEGLDGSLREWASKFPPTRRLYHEDPYMREFTAKVLGFRDRWLVLDATCFYPTAGGQIHDVGEITVGSKSYRVVDVAKVGDVVLHKLDRPLEIDGDAESISARGSIDWERRFRIMRHHTATHIVLAAIRSVFGDHIWQAGAEKTEFKGRLDVTHYRLPSESELARIEELANAVVDQRRSVVIHSLDRYDAESRFGLKIYQGGVPDTRVLRIVEIPGWDAEACYGTHVRNTGEVGGVKIVNVSKIADGVVRFEYVAGSRIAEEYGREYKSLKPVMEVLKSGSISELRARVEGLIRQVRDMESVLSKYRSQWISSFLDRIDKIAIRVGGVRIIPVIDPPEISIGREILKKVTGMERSIGIMLVSRGEKTMVEISVSRDLLDRVSARDLMASLASSLGGKGGGRPDHASGVVGSSSREVLRSLTGFLEDA